MSCAVKGCENGGRLHRGWCATHYSRWRLKGDPGDAVIQRKYPIPLAVCDECGKKFKPRRLRERTSHLCSKECRTAAATTATPPDSKECPVCRTEFGRRSGESPINYDRRLTCSGDCARALVGLNTSNRCASVGSRTLVAKTCCGCGHLKDADGYSRRQEGLWPSECRDCKADASGVWYREHQDASAVAAPNRGNYWTGAELELVARQDLSSQELAGMLGRTVAGVRWARKLLTDDPRRQRVAGVAAGDR